MREKLNTYLNQRVEWSSVGVYLLFLLLLVAGFLVSGKMEHLPNAELLTRWDADWYHSIMEKGYFIGKDQGGNAGFFPGFPMLWKALGWSAAWMSLFNFGVFLLGFFLMCNQLKLSNLKAFYLLSFPSLFFFYVPYSEALFFTFCVGALFFYTREKYLYAASLALLMMLVRPAIFFLLPALVGAYVLKKNNFSITKMIVSSAVILLGTAIGFGIIGYVTGNFFSYSEAQVTHWNHYFSFPSFPLTTWRGYRILWLDGWALFVLIFVAFALLSLVMSHYRRKTNELQLIDIVSLIYLSMILVYVLFFHPKEDGRTTLLSLNRYVFCSPFFHYIAARFLFSFSCTKKNVYTILGAIVLSLGLLGFPYASVVGLNLVNSYIFFVGLFVLIAMQSSVLFQAKSNWIYLVLIVCNFALQVYLFQGFLKGNWIG